MNKAIESQGIDELGLSELFRVLQPFSSFYKLTLRDSTVIIAL